MTDPLEHAITSASSAKRKPILVRFAELAVGFITNAVMNWAFDWLLYPLVIYKLGLLRGGLVMSIASFLSCLGLLRLYDFLQRDWLGIETIRALRLSESPRGWRRPAGMILRRGNAVAFVFLSLYFDPFITTVYLRQGRYNGMGRRDWGVFVGSWALGNGSWMMMCYLGVGALEWVWHLLVR